MRGAYGMPEKHLSFDQFLNHIRKHAKTPTDKGSQFAPIISMSNGEF